MRPRHFFEGSDLASRQRAQRGIALRKLLQPFGLIEIAPLRTKHADRFLLIGDALLKLALKTHRTFRAILDVVKPDRKRDHRRNEKEIDETDHPAPPHMEGTARMPSACRSSGFTGAPVRMAARSFAERARALSSTSSSAALRALRAISAKLFASSSTAGM